MKAIVYGFSDEFDGWKEVLGVLSEEQEKASKQMIEQAQEKMQKKHGKDHYIRVVDLEELNIKSASALLKKIREKSGLA